ncbi:hypothetical protein DFH06DRAFT_1339973 [Mycena polygramma]|nr:hypothetical protein DFH06DRAFT_1339973 [Mycena polygramma]
MALHNTGTYWVDRLGVNCSSTTVLMFQLFIIPADVLRQTSTIRLAKGDNKNWPRSVSEVAPFGFDALVEVVGQWAVMLPNSSPLVYLGNTLHVCGRSVFTAVTSSPNFLDRLIYALRTTCEWMRSARTDRLPLHPMWMIAMCICRILLERTSRNGVEIWVRGREVELYTLLSEAITICCDPQLSLDYPDGAKEDLALSVNFFHAFTVHFSADVPRPPDLHPELAPAPDSGPVEPADRLRSHLLSRSDTCYAAGCTHTFQEVGHAFQKCAGCKYVAYCSRECQAADWRDPDFPHKRICKQLQVFDAAGGRGEKETFLSNFDHSVGDEVVEPLIAWFKVRDERKEMEDLRRASR